MVALGDRYDDRIPGRLWHRLRRVNFVDIQARISLLQLHVLVLGFGCYGYTPHPCGDECISAGG